MDKRTALDALLAAAQSDLDGALDVARKAVHEATGDESRAENKYDTRSLEASYLARGQAERLGELRALVSHLTTADRRDDDSEVVKVGSFVVLESEAAKRFYVMAPLGGGLRAEVDGERVALITPSSPLGRTLLGSEVDDEADVQGPGDHDWWIAEIH